MTTAQLLVTKLIATSFLSSSYCSYLAPWCTVKNETINNKHVTAKTCKLSIKTISTLCTRIRLVFSILISLSNVHSNVVDNYNSSFDGSWRITARMRSRAHVAVADAAAAAVGVGQLPEGSSVPAVGSRQQDDEEEGGESCP